MYDAVIVAAGTQHGKEITWVPKWNYEQVYTAIQFMDFANNDQSLFNIGKDFKQLVYCFPGR